MCGVSRRKKYYNKYVCTGNKWDTAAVRNAPAGGSHTSLCLHYTIFATTTFGGKETSIRTPH